MEARQPFQQIAPPQAVFGLAIQDPNIAAKTRRVIVLALLAAGFVLLEFIWNISFNRGNGVIASVLGVCLAFLVPACGYFGAKNNDANLTCCFCGCNFLGGCCHILTVILLYASLAVLQHVMDQCNPDAPAVSNCPDLTQLCPDLGSDGTYTAEDCYHHIQDNLGKVKTGFWVAVVFMVPSVLLQCCSFWHGNELYRVLQQGQVIVAAPQYQTAVVAGQPYAPSMQPYAPSAQPYAPAAQPYAPSAQPYAPAAQPYAPAAQPYAPAAQPYAPSAPTAH